MTENNLATLISGVCQFALLLQQLRPVLYHRQRPQ